MEKLEHSEYETNRTGGDGKGAGKVKAQDMSLLHDRLYETLVCFDEFCAKHDIKYILAGGTCLGAVRDHDIIPWDGDLDVAVLRDDFEKLFREWEISGDKEHFSLYRTTEDFCAYVPIGLMRHNGTTYIRSFEEGLTDRNLGVKIDIEPMDEVPANPRKRKIQRFFAYFHVAFLTQRIPREQSKKITMGVKLVLGIFRGKKIRNAILRYTGKQIRKYNGTGCEKVAINGLGGLSYRSDIVESQRVPFHGGQFCIPVNYDEYLRWEYGDYMALPPVEKREFFDDPVYYDLNMSYQDYLVSNNVEQK